MIVALTPVLSVALLIESRMPASVWFELSTLMLKLFVPTDTVKIPVPTTEVGP
jgi:hypothetical protein